MQGHGKMQVVDTDELLDMLLESAGDKVVLLDVFASWCPPCKRLAPQLEEMSVREEFREAVFLKLDGDLHCPEAMARFRASGFSGYPTIKFFRRGKQVSEIVGADAQAIQSTLSALCKEKPPAPDTQYSSFPAKQFFSVPAPSRMRGIKVQRAVGALVSKIGPAVYESDASAYVIDEETAQTLSTLAEVLEDVTMYHSSTLAGAPAAAQAGLEMLGSWPFERVFPMLDLLRVMVLHGDGAKALAASPELVRLVWDRCQREAGSAECAGSVRMGLCLLVNGLKATRSQEAFLAALPLQAGCRAPLDALLSSDDPEVPLATAKLLHNHAAALYQMVRKQWQESEKSFSGKAISEPSNVCREVFQQLPPSVPEKVGLVMCIAVGTYLWVCHMLGGAEEGLSLGVARASLPGAAPAAVAALRPALELDAFLMQQDPQ